MTARETALQVLSTWESTERRADAILERELARSALSSRDRALTQNLVYGVLRWKGRLDWVLDQYVRGGLSSLPISIRNALRLGLYQIDFLDRIPPRAAVNESVRLARRFGHRGTAGLVNAVLRNILTSLRPDFPDAGKDPVGHISTMQSHPRVLVARWIAQFGVENTTLLCEYDNQPPRLVARANGLSCSADALAMALAAEGVPTKPGRYFPECLELIDAGDVTRLTSFGEGLLQIQDESTLAAVRLLAPHRGECVVDLCAAPGGKTTFIAEMMRGEGRLIAHDVSPERIEMLRANIERLGVENCEVACTPQTSDGLPPWTRTDADAGEGPSRDVLEDLLGRVDAVLVDAPCTGTGTLARRADARWKFDLRARERTREHVEDHERYHPRGILSRQTSRQLKLLVQAADLVKVGGRVVYSTCSLEPEENEQVVERFLVRRPEFRREDPTPFVPTMFADGEHVRILPHRHGIDGAFAARLVRTRESDGAEAAEQSHAVTLEREGVDEPA